MIKKAVGRGSASQKYDILTIMGTYALSQDRTLQRQTLRLICLITARYNWQRNQLEMGQTEIARLWSCDTRTVKREMAAFRTRGWLVELRAAARGRVAVHGLGIAQILEDTRAVWEKIGPDVVQRLAPTPEPAVESKVIPFPSAPRADHNTPWGIVAEALFQEDPAVFAAWFAALDPRYEEDTLYLHAPGGFQARYIETHLRGRIERHLSRVAPEIRLMIT